MRLMLAIVMSVTLGACANDGLRQITSTSPGPDEFLIEPKKPLQNPSNFNALPVPTPGQSNLVDNDPVDDVIVALGGRPSQGTAVPASDGALVTAASRFGVTPGIRSELAASDAEFRRKQARFTQFRLFPEDRYLQAYRKQVLDGRETANQWRRAGAITPSYPPSN
jgi:hypothetical protein